MVTVAGEKVMSGSQRVGWDPVAGKLRARLNSMISAHDRLAPWRAQADSASAAAGARS